MKQVRCHSSICKQVLYFVSLFLAFNSNAFAYTTSEFFLPFQEGTTLYKANYMLPRHYLLTAMEIYDAETENLKKVPLIPIVANKKKLPLRELYRQSMTESTRHKETSLLEMAFQFSFKVPLFRLITTDSRCYFGYTQRSWWQTYTGKSALFREVDHNPEIFIEQPLMLQIPYLGLNIKQCKLGLIHQSNGEGWYYERGWDRAYMELTLEWKNFTLQFLPWCSFDNPLQKIPFKEKYNFDIDEHLGFYQVKLTYERAGFQWSIQLQGPSFEGDIIKNEDSIKKMIASKEVLVAFPITRTFEGMIYYFDGKGSTLGLYNQSSQSVGFGIKLRR